MIWSKDDLTRLLKEWSVEGIPMGGVALAPLKLIFFVNGENIFDYEDREGKIALRTADEEKLRDIKYSLDRCGFFDIAVTHLSIDGSSEIKKISDRDFKDWFLKILTPIEDVFLIPDTSLFISKHYFSNVLFPLLGESYFSKIRFFIPRLVILEIERKCDQSKKGKQKRLAYYATKELMLSLIHI